MEQKKLPATSILFFLVSLSSVASVIYTPALPQIKAHFGITSDQAQWTVNLFLFGYAFSQLIYAPLANRFNRKNSLFFGLATAALGTVISLFSYPLESYPVLLFGLFITSLGSSAGLSLVFTIIGDVYDAQQARKVIPMISPSFSLMPGLNIFIASFLVDRYPWPSCFLFILGYFLFSALLVSFLPETSDEVDPHALKLKNIVSRYKTAIKSWTLWHYSLIWGLCTGIVYIFLSTAPLLVIGKMQVSPSAYGTFTLITTVGYVTGTIFTRSLVHRLSPVRMMTTGLVVALAGSVGFNALLRLTAIGPWDVFLPTFFVFFGLPPIFSTASSLAVKDQKDKATASSLMTFIDVIVPVILIFGITLIPGNPEKVIAEVIFTVLGTIALLLFCTRYLPKE